MAVMRFSLRQVLSITMMTVTRLLCTFVVVVAAIVSQLDDGSSDHIAAPGQLRQNERDRSRS